LSREHTATYKPGLPDGLFSNQKSKFGEISEGLAMKDVVVFYGHLVHFTVFCYILWTFGIVRDNLVFCTKKNLATLMQTCAGQSYKPALVVVVGILHGMIYHGGPCPGKLHYELFRNLCN
jgi:hypothetical protein